MLVTFRSKAWSNITMLGDVATTLLQMTGHSGTIPGALRAADIPRAITRLRQSLAAVPAGEKKPSDADQDDAEPPVSLHAHAHPLLQLLSAADQQQCDVLWDKGAPLV